MTLLLELLTTIVSANGSSRSLHVFSTALPCDVLRVVLHTCPGQCVECCIGLQRAVRFAFTIWALVRQLAVHGSHYRAQIQLSIVSAELLIRYIA